MKTRWLQKNVNISDIEEAVTRFLKQRGFRTTSTENKDLQKICGILQDTKGAKKVIINIKGEPNDFMVDFIAGETAQAMARFASLITFFGGGPLELTSLKEKEYYQKLEEEFWTYIEGFIASQCRR